MVETHVSTLFFAGDRVFKRKKAVDLGFLDFTTREAREEACHREVELNRRLAPDVYLGVADVSLDGVVCDHLVVMRRLPEARRLAALVRRGDDVDLELQRLAHLIAAFHARAARSPAIDETASPAALVRNWDDNATQMARFVGDVLPADRAARVRALAHGYLAGREVLLGRRIAGGHICDGHGDLLAEDIFCLEDGPRVLDCIDFDERLRAGDVLADVAFLAMDLERLGRPDAAAAWLAAYRDDAGETWPASLAHHYVAYRAQVRSKVACLRHAQGDDRAAAEAVALLDLAGRHLEAGQVCLVLLGGLPGTGKSTAARGLAEARGWTLLRSDEVRKQLAGLDPATPAVAGPGEGLYRPEGTEATYDELLRRARVALELGEPVVIDASWTSQRRRAEARRVAAATSSRIVELCCTAPVALAAARVDARRRGGDLVSDATPAVAAAMAAGADPWPVAATIDTTGSIAATSAHVAAAVSSALEA